MVTLLRHHTEPGALLEDLPVKAILIWKMAENIASYGSTDKPGGSGKLNIHTYIFNTVKLMGTVLRITRCYCMTGRWQQSR